MALGLAEAELMEFMEANTEKVFLLAREAFGFVLKTLRTGTDATEMDMSPAQQVARLTVVRIAQSGKKVTFRQAELLTTLQATAFLHSNAT